MGKRKEVVSSELFGSIWLNLGKGCGSIWVQRFPHDLTRHIADLGLIGLWFRTSNSWICVVKEIGSNHGFNERRSELEEKSQRGVIIMIHTRDRDLYEIWFDP